MKNKSLLELIVADCNFTKARVLAWEENSLAVKDIEELQPIMLIQFAVIREKEYYKFFGPWHLMVTQSTFHRNLSQEKAEELGLPTEDFFDLVKLADLPKTKSHLRADVLAIVADVTEIQHVKNSLVKRLKILDNTGRRTFALWNADTELDVNVGDVLIFAAAAIGKGGTLTAAAYIETQPIGDEVDEIREWSQENPDLLKLWEKHDNEELEPMIKSISKVRSMETNYKIDKQIEFEECIVIAKIVHIRANSISYPDSNTGELKFKMFFILKDEHSSEELEVIAFDNVCNKFFNSNAMQMEKLKDQKPQEFENIMKTICRSQQLYWFKLAIQESNYIDGTLDYRVDFIRKQHEKEDLQNDDNEEEELKNNDDETQEKMKSLSLEPTHTNNKQELKKADDKIDETKEESKNEQDNKNKTTRSKRSRRKRT